MSIVSGIYVIRNKTNGKIYIGSSKNIRRRMHEHRSELRRGIHDNDHLQKAWRKYGEDAFEFEVLEQCEVAMLIEREQYWLDVTDTSITYNIAKFVAATTLGYKHTPETKAFISKLHKGRKISLEARMHMSEAQLKRERPPKKVKVKKARQSPSAELRYQYGSGARGKKRTPESVARMVDKIALEYIVTMPDGTEMKIKNLNAFCRDHGLSTTHMAKVSRLERNHYKGWKCRKVDNA